MAMCRPLIEMMCARPAARRLSTCSRGMNASWPVIMAAASPPLSGPRRGDDLLGQRPARGVDPHGQPQPPRRRGRRRSTAVGARSARPTAPTLSKIGVAREVVGARLRRAAAAG